jgi:hypothetical protein
MVDKTSSPAFTIGSLHKSPNLNNNVVPGPGSYETISYLKQSKSSNQMY